MGRIAFIFAGQGDQYPGMGKALQTQYPAAAEVFRVCEDVRPGTLRQCFEGTAAELTETKNTQPCMFAMELAAAEALRAQGVEPEAVAGFSLGEVAAATFAGYCDLPTGFRLVCRRGELMQAEADKHDTAMAAVVKLPPETVIRLTASCSDLYPVNFNCPGQITVSGCAAQMPAFFAEVKAAGGKALLLKVKGAFHSPYMAPAAEAFRAELAQADLRPGRLPLYSNVTAEPYGDDVVTLLSRQIASPVQWERLVRNMIASGIDTFVEIGPGRTLTNMVKKIDPTVTAKTVTEFLTEVTPC